MCVVLKRNKQKARPIGVFQFILLSTNKIISYRKADRKQQQILVQSVDARLESVFV